MTMADRLAMLRRRIDATPSQVSDEQLTHFLVVADTVLGPWLISDAFTLFPANVDEGVVEVAVKFWDVAARGVTTLGPDGEWSLPAASATPGLARAGFAALGPALRAGGLTV